MATQPNLPRRLPALLAPALLASALLAPALLASALFGPAPAGAQQVTESAYARAEQFLPWNASKLISGDQVTPEFFDGDRFWFRSRTSSGHEFIVVDPAARSRAPAFDHARLAAALSVAADTAYEGRTLPFDEFDFVNGGGAIRFQVADSVQWICDIGAYTCAGPTTATAPSAAERPSPDGRWIAFARDENMWVRDAASGDETRLTDDGETDFGYGAIPEGCCQEITSRRANRERSPVMQWSPDSRRIATHRYDEREVERFHLLEAADGRPILHSWAYALPGDSVVPTSRAVAARRGGRHLGPCRRRAPAGQFRSRRHQLRGCAVDGGRQQRVLHAPQPRLQELQALPRGRRHRERHRTPGRDRADLRRTQQLHFVPAGLAGAGERLRVSLVVGARRLRAPVPVRR